MIRILAVASLLLLPLSALAVEPQCKFNEPRELNLDLAGAKAVVFEVNQHNLVLTAGPGPAQLGGRACASNTDWLRGLTVTQQKVDGKRVVRLKREVGPGFTLSSSNYTVGSGDLELDSMQGNVELGTLGSGDADLRQIKGNVSVGNVGSGPEVRA